MPLKAIIEFSFSSNSFFSTIYSIKLISFHPNRAITLFAKSKECVFKEKKKRKKKKSEIEEQYEQTPSLS